MEFNYRYITDQAYHDPLSGVDTDSSVSDTTSSEYSTEAASSSNIDVTIAPQESYHLHPLSFMVINYYWTDKANQKAKTKKHLMYQCKRRSIVAQCCAYPVFLIYNRLTCINV